MSTQKIIKVGAFRELSPGECRILFLRHEEHTNDITSTEGLQRLFRLGQTCQNAGLTVESAYSSPADRCLTAVLAVKCGMGCAKYTQIDRRLAPMEFSEPERVTELKKEATKAGMSVHEYVFHLIETDTDFKSEMFMKRGEEGARALSEIASEHAGESVLVGSHSATKMEVTIATLKGDPHLNNVPPIKTGQIVELILKLDDATELKVELVECNYLSIA
ncbi:MAG: histidine phosphatase family protein [Patescibacteria group bacterium]|jgi:broad specificity phosphatase PhoE